MKYVDVIFTFISISGYLEQFTQCSVVGYNEWIQFNCNKYMFIDTRKSWEDASIACNQENANLLAPESTIEQIWVTSQIISLSSTVWPGFWIGIHDTRSEGTFVRVDGCPLNFSEWAEGEPDQHGGLNEDCVEMERKNGNWNDFDCESRLPFICKYPAGNWSGLKGCNVQPCASTTQDLFISSKVTKHREHTTPPEDCKFQPCPSTTQNLRFLSNITTHTEATIPQENDVVIPTVASVASLLVITGLVIIGVFYHKRRQAARMRQNKQHLQDIEIRHVQNTYNHQHPRNKREVHLSSLLRSLLSEESRIQLSPLLVDVSQVQIKEKLGQGAFGCVFRGEYRIQNNIRNSTRTVAIKTLKEGCSFAAIVQFVNEALIMAEFKNQHVMPILGVCVTVETGAPMIIMPFMKYGDLQSYLRKIRYGEITSQVPSTLELLEFGRQIARGMEYLESLKFVHRDLATRNCMINEQLSVMVADFGLARDIYSDSFYKQDKQDLLPIKWMAIECLKDRIFTTYSDVWAYGVTLWEIMSLAQIPYSTLSNSEILTYLQSGGRLDKPERCSDEIFEIMQSCWNIIPTDRPSFKQIAYNIDGYLSSQLGYLQFESPNDESDDQNYHEKGDFGFHRDFNYVPHQEADTCWLGDETENETTRL